MIDLAKARRLAEAARCHNCNGRGSLPTPCPDGKIGCLVYHAIPCRACDGGKPRIAVVVRQLADEVERLRAIGSVSATRRVIEARGHAHAAFRRGQEARRARCAEVARDRG